jgi:hypothetical protein
MTTTDPYAGVTREDIIDDAVTTHEELLEATDTLEKASVRLDALEVKLDGLVRLADEIYERVMAKETQEAAKLAEHRAELRDLRQALGAPVGGLQELLVILNEKIGEDDKAR